MRILIACLLVAGCTNPLRAPSEVSGPSVDCFRRIVEILAHDDMQGRGVGTAGLERAAHFLENEFAEIGLEEIGDGYLRPFETVMGVELGAENSLSWNPAVARVGSDFTPLGFSSKALSTSAKGAGE